MIRLTSDRVSGIIPVGMWLYIFERATCSSGSRFSAVGMLCRICHGRYQSSEIDVTICFFCLLISKNGSNLNLNHCTIPTPRLMSNDKLLILAENFVSLVLSTLLGLVTNPCKVVAPQLPSLEMTSFREDKNTMLGPELQPRVASS